MNDHEAELISGKFLDYEIPTDKKYLLKYFRKDWQVMFIKYYLVFGNTTRFTDHTGWYISTRFLRICKNRLRRLEAIKLKARADMDFDRLVKLESGKFKLSSVSDDTKRKPRAGVDPAQDESD